MTGTKKGTEKKNTVSKKSHQNRIFVTGASGFLGQHLLQTLKHRGFEYTALSRTSDEEGFVQGDILKREGLESLMEGHDILIHAAGLVSRDPKDSDFLWNYVGRSLSYVCPRLHTAPPSSPPCQRSSCPSSPSTTVHSGGRRTGRRTRVSMMAAISLQALFVPCSILRSPIVLGTSGEILSLHHE